jgi:subtilase family serine protease
MTSRHKKIENLIEPKDSIIFFNSLNLNEIKEYAKILNTPLYKENWKFISLHSIENNFASKKDIIEDIIETLFEEI